MQLRALKANVVVKGREVGLGLFVLPIPPHPVVKRLTDPLPQLQEPARPAQAHGDPQRGRGLPVHGGGLRLLVPHGPYHAPALQTHARGQPIAGPGRSGCPAHSELKSVLGSRLPLEALNLLPTVPQV